MSEFPDSFLKDLEENCLFLLPPSQLPGRGHRHHHNITVQSEQRGSILIYDPLVPQFDDAVDPNSDIEIEPQIDLLPPTEDLAEVINIEFQLIVDEYSSGSEFSSQADSLLDSEEPIYLEPESEAKSKIEEATIESDQVHPNPERKEEMGKKSTNAKLTLEFGVEVKRSLRIKLRKERQKQIEKTELFFAVQQVPRKLKPKAIMPSKKTAPKRKSKSKPIISSRNYQNNMNLEDQVHEILGIKIKLTPQKRAPKKPIPEESKDEKYWAWRRKNTEMARKSRKVSELKFKKIFAYVTHLGAEKQRKLNELRKLTRLNERLEIIRSNIVRTL